ncbi:hypothetical protein SUDANB176_06135 [Streptomyces sp. enrichment culture]
MAVEPPIELRDVNKHFGDLHVLRDIDLTVGRGEVVVVIGPSGSGKSALCRTVGDRAPDEFFTAPNSDRAGDFLSKILKH